MNREELTLMWTESLKPDEYSRDKNKEWVIVNAGILHAVIT